MNNYNLKNGIAEIGFMIIRNNKTSIMRIRFILDTGASSTTISKDDLSALGYDKEWINSNIIRTGNKKYMADGSSVDEHYVIIPYSSIFGYRLLNWPFYILEDRDLAKRNYGNYISQDILININYYFNNDNSKLEISKVKNKILRNKVHDKQSINSILDDDN